MKLVRLKINLSEKGIIRRTHWKISSRGQKNHECGLQQVVWSTVGHRLLGQKDTASCMKLIKINQELDIDFPTKINLNVIASVLEHFTFYHSNVFSPGRVRLARCSQSVTGRASSSSWHWLWGLWKLIHSFISAASCFSGSVSRFHLFDCVRVGIPVVATLAETSVNLMFLASFL